MTLKNYVIKPFENVQEKTLLLIGLSAGVVNCYLSTLTYSRSIAILKQATINKNPSLLQTLGDYVITSLIMAIALFLLGRVINKRTRFIDIINTVLIARIGLDISVVFDINGYMSSIVNQLLKNPQNPELLLQSDPWAMIYLIIVSLVSILMLVLFGYYIYQGFKTATHLKKTSMIIVFVITILAVDTLTRYITRLY
ncbi:hypothetical protein [Myroides pelagicus]|uniref:Yip1 domain-containing protein n=1 Tax=Myroides pelagicus TaxID=270914 RepID=A0A7K1GK79_9FLAO|nr:hypothetical protein [Myroides pelagicus]MEC4114724.1 hypothetical protein [Myroides pelagicus]MTH29277.1 hypothetical protein [Myroides pelagicus]